MSGSALDVRASGGGAVLAEPRAHGRVVRLALLFLALLFVGVWVLWLLMLAGAVDEFEARLDFFAYWGGSSLVLDGEAAAAFDRDRMREVQLDLPGASQGTFVWLYPPTFFFFVLPLALVPVAAAMTGWVVLTGGLMLSAVRRIRPDWSLMSLAFLFPATYLNFLNGQNGMLTAGLFAWGLLLLRDRPVLAGVLLGLLTYKPQFFPLVFLALLVSRQKQAAVASLATAGALALASLAVFGFEAWEAFYTAVTDTGADIYSDSPFVRLDKMQSISATLLLAGAPAIAGQFVQAVFAIGAAGFVVWLWRADAAFEYRAAGLALGVLLATPYSYHYDLTLLGLAGLWLGLGLHREGTLDRKHVSLLALAWWLPLLGPLISQHADVVIAPFVVLVLAYSVFDRVRRLRPPAEPAGPMLAAAPV